MEDNYALFGDCRDYFPLLPSGIIDLVLADNPYGETAHKQDVIIPFNDLWSGYNRLTKKDANIVLFAQGKFYAKLVLSNEKNFRYDLVWDKILISGPLNAKRRPLRVHEQVAVFYRKLGTYNPQMKDGPPLHSKGTKYKDKGELSGNYGKHFNTPNHDMVDKKYPKSIFTFQKPHPSKAKHRTEKPVELLEELTLTYSNVGETILDNATGCGNTGVAAWRHGRKFILIEKDPVEYQKMLINLDNNQVKYRTEL